ncbi:MAG TPA: insulinase family protein [bacterium]|nr:insulinase family protein [bacterium]
MFFRVDETLLNNGIRVLSQCVPGSNSVALGIWIKAGSRYELDTQNGISHFLEHMVFTGTQTRDARDIAISLESLGGHLNAFTEKETIAFHSWTMPDHMHEAFEVLSDLVLNATLKPSAIRKEKTVVLEEIHSLYDSPEDLVQDILIRTVFGKHSLGRPILGTADSISRLLRSDLDRYRAEHYTAENILVTAAGKLHHESLIQLAKKYLSDVPAGSEKKVEPPVFGGTIRREDKMPFQQNHLCIGIPGFAMADERRYVLVLINQILGVGMSSRLFQELRENRGWVYSIYTFLECWKDSGLLGIYAGTAPVHTEKVIRGIRAEIDKLTRKSITVDELNRVKRRIEGHLILAHEDVNYRMDRLARFALYDQPVPMMEETIARFNSITPVIIQKTARELFEEQSIHESLLISETAA